MVLFVPNSPSSSLINNNNNNNEGSWGMGFLLVFFHSDHNNGDPPFYKKQRSSHTCSLLTSPLKPSSSSRKHLVSRIAQSTLTICVVLVLLSLLLFALSTFDTPHRKVVNNRRILMSNHHNNNNKKLSMFGDDYGNKDRYSSTSMVVGSALHGMGSLYRRGSKGMTDLVVGHVAEGAKEREIRSFLRLVHHSGLLSRSDLVFIFDSSELASRLGRVVKAECDSFGRLIDMNVEGFNSSGSGHGSGFGLARYLRPVGEDEKEAMWGRKGNNMTRIGGSNRSSYGSVVGFDSSELDPEDSLSGFLGRVPMGLRRWACYPMLLGRVRRQFKHTMLVDVRTTLVISDPFSAIRNRSTESVLVWSNSDTESTRHGRRNSGGSGGSGGPHSLNPSMIIGGGRGVRRFTTAALTEIVRLVVEHKGKGKNSVTESGLIKQLVHNGHLLKSINLINSGETVPEVSSLTGFNSVDSDGAGILTLSNYFTVVQRGRSNNVDIDLMIKKEICTSHELYTSVYKDCLASS